MNSFTNLKMKINSSKSNGASKDVDSFNSMYMSSETNSSEDDSGIDLGTLMKSSVRKY